MTNEEKFKNMLVEEKPVHSHKRYYDIIEAEGVIRAHLIDGWTIDEILEAASDELGRYSKISRIKAVAIKTVLETGMVYNMYGVNRFFMPSTRDCLKNFQRCRKEMNKEDKRRKGHRINCLLWDEE